MRRKICPKCGRILPHTEDHFHRADKHGRLRGVCKDCINAAARERHRKKTARLKARTGDSSGSSSNHTPSAEKVRSGQPTDATGSPVGKSAGRVKGFSAPPKREFDVPRLVLVDFDRQMYTEYRAVREAPASSRLAAQIVQDIYELKGVPVVVRGELESE